MSLQDCWEVDANLSIREPKTPGDFLSLAALAEQLTKYHGEDRRPATEKLMSDTDWFSARLLTVDETDVGFVAWHRVYACQSAERGIELQNLYVDEKYRGKRLGFRLVLEVVTVALEMDCAEIKIGVRKENALAVNFYRKPGCSVIDRNDSWRCKLGRTQMEQLVPKLLS